jgi:hypothetical protein
MEITLELSPMQTETEHERKERIRMCINQRLKNIGEPHTIGQFLNHFYIDLQKDEILELLIPEILTGEFIKYYNENGQDVVHYYSLIHLIERTMGIYSFAERRAEYLIKFDHKKAIKMIGDKEFFKNGLYVYGIDW